MNVPVGVPVLGERGLPGSLDDTLVPIYCLWLGEEHRLMAEDIGKCGAGLRAERVGKGTSESGQSQARSEEDVQEVDVIALGQRSV